MKNILWVAVLLFSVSINAKVSVGDMPPSYLGKDKNGDSIELSEMKGKVVVATFWATWCPPCMKEMELLEQIQRQVGKEQLEVVAINFKESRKTYKKIVKLLKDFEITITYDRKGRVANKYEIDAVPRMFIINKSGTVAYTHKGYGEDMLPKIIDELNGLLSSSEG